MKPRNWTEDDLFRLKEAMDSELLCDYDSQRMESRIHQAVTAPDSRRVPRARRRFGPLAAGAIALCVAGIAAGAVFKHAGSSGPFLPVSPRTTNTSSSLWTQGFAPTPAEVFHGYQHVTSMSVFLGPSSVPQTADSVDNASFSLTPSQQRELYALLQSSKSKPAVTGLRTQTTDFPFQITLSRTNGQWTYTDAFLYSPSGAMVMGKRLYAPNPRLAKFLNQNLLEKIRQKYKQAGKVLPTSLATAALGFVRNLSHPQDAYRYSVPDMVFARGTDPTSLQKEATSKDFAHYQIVSTTYGPGRQSATVVLHHPHRFWASPVSLNLIHLGGAWLVTQASTSAATGTAYSGMPPIHGFGSYKTLIIGPKVGTITPSQAAFKYTTVTYSDLSSPVYQTARIFIYERKPLFLNSTQGDAAQALKSDPAFQKAAAEAKAHHGVLIVAGGGDNLLTRNVVSQALGGIQSTTGTDSQPSAFISVWFVNSKYAVLGGGSFGAAGPRGKAASFNALSPIVLNTATDQATLMIDTWGAVLF